MATYFFQMEKYLIIVIVAKQTLLIHLFFVMMLLLPLLRGQQNALHYVKIEKHTCMMMKLETDSVTAHFRKTLELS